MTQPTTSQAVAVAEKKHVSAEAYMAHYAHDYYEWVKGELFKITPVSLRHDQIVGYLRSLFEAYFTLKTSGIVVSAPFVMQVDATQSRREPDLQIILNDNDGNLTDTAMIGPADICIEVVSPESVARDHGEKFAEYEKGGVKEYWIVDHIHKSCRFNRLNEEGLYTTTQIGLEGTYEPPLLPGLKLNVSTLWRETLPNFLEIGKSVQAMLAE